MTLGSDPECGSKGRGKSPGWLPLSRVEEEGLWVRLGELPRGCECS